MGFPWFSTFFVCLPQGQSTNSSWNFKATLALLGVAEAVRNGAWGWHRAAAFNQAICRVFTTKPEEVEGVYIIVLKIYWNVMGHVMEYGLDKLGCDRNVDQFFCTQKLSTQPATNGVYTMEMLTFAHRLLVHIDYCDCLILNLEAR